MKRWTTKILTKEAALLVAQNFRWFAGWPYKIKQLGPDRYSVRTLTCLWSHIVLTEDDYAD